MQLCMGNGLYDLPSLSSEVCVKPAEGDGFCFVYSALAATGQADSERAAKACLRRASKHLYEFVRKDVDPVSLAEDQEGMQVSIGCEVLSCSHVCMLGCPSCSTCIVCMPTDKTHVKNIYKCAQEAMRHDMLTELDDPQHHTLHGVGRALLRPIETTHGDNVLGLTPMPYSRREHWLSIPPSG